jgi:hypothetical protein
MRWPAKPARASRVNAAGHDAPVVDRRLALPAVMSALMVAVARRGVGGPTVVAPYGEWRARD